MNYLSGFVMSMFSPAVSSVEVSTSSVDSVDKPPSFLSSSHSSNNNGVVGPVKKDSLQGLHRSRSDSYTSNNNSSGGLKKYSSVVKSTPGIRINDPGSSLKKGKSQQQQ